MDAGYSRLNSAVPTPRIRHPIANTQIDFDLQPARTAAQREGTITNRFLVCYLTAPHMRLLQVKVLGDVFCSEKVIQRPR